VLDVDRREHVDPGREDILDVLETLGVLGPRRVRVGELVDQAQLRRAAQDRRQVHLLQRGLAVAHAPAGQDRRPVGQAAGLGPAVRLEQADHHVSTRLQLRATLQQHAVGLADPCSHPDEDLQAPSALIVGGWRGVRGVVRDDRSVTLRGGCARSGRSA
jgi:hypothetical protein